MPSNTTITKARRRIRKRKLGRDAKRERAKAGTPKFPLDPSKSESSLERSTSKTKP